MLSLIYIWRLFVCVCSNMFTTKLSACLISFLMSSSSSLFPQKKRSKRQFQKIFFFWPKNVIWSTTCLILSLFNRNMSLVFHYLKWSLLQWMTIIRNYLFIIFLVLINLFRLSDTFHYYLVGCNFVKVVRWLFSSQVWPLL